MIAETLLLLPFHMSTVVDGFLSYELSSNSLRFESQLPVFGEKILHTKEQIKGFLSCKQFSVPVSKQEQILVILERSIRD